MNTLIDHLKFLGLNEKQAHVYIALIELGRATGYEVALKSKIKRPTCYVILEELRQKGLVLKFPDTKKHLFVAKHPEELFTEYEEKFKNAKRALPELLAKASSNSKKVKVLYFEGKTGVKESLEYKIDTLKAMEILGFYAKKKDSTSPIPKIYFDYNKKLFDQKSTIRGFAPLHGSLKEFRKLDMAYKWNIIPLNTSEFSSDVSIEVTSEFVRVILHKSAQSVIIESSDFAKTMQELFEIIWKAKIK